MALSTELQIAGLRKAFDYINEDPAVNLPKAVNMLKHLVPRGEGVDTRITTVENVLSDPGNVWNQYLLDLFTNIDPGVRKATFENFVINGSIRQSVKASQLRDKYNCAIPWAILMDPTSACNLHCTGCWAAEYGNRLNLSYDEMDSIIRQANELGTYVFLFTGGEPTVRKNDVFKLCEAHPDCQFTAFTNGILIDEAFADEMLRVKNFIPAISVEGFEEDTDFRRGNGTFRKVERAMKILKEKKLPFGISCCYTSKNVDMIGSEAYFDQMIEWGAKFCWFFTYMPVGNAAVPELMVTAEQRRFMYDQVRRFRQTKPLFTIDFWNDGEYVHGCIAGGRRYLHINANGDYEPCAFIHYSDTNIRTHTLLQALQAPLFQAYRQGQPFNNNYLRPCPLLDNPNALRKMVHESGAVSTDLESPEDIEKAAAKCDEKAAAWGRTADSIWTEHGHELGGEHIYYK